MAASPNAVDESSLQPSTAWSPQDDQEMGPTGNVQSANGASLPVDDRNTAGQDPENAEYSRGASIGDISVSSNKGDSYREKQRKPNKVYIGGLPEHTREEDLQSCFGKIGNIINIELKVGYGFVEFDSREAAEESVAKYHEGFFMGNKIRVEISHGGGRTAKYAGDPGACFKCGQMGHWARECPNHPGPVPHRRPHYEAPLIDRIQRDYPPRNVALPRDDIPSTRYTSRETRYDYAPPASRDFRRPPSPRVYREYPSVPPSREYDDYRRGPPSAHERDRYAPPAGDFRPRYSQPVDSAYRGYAGAPPPPAFPYDRYDRRAAERYPPSYVPPSGARPRTPPRTREDFDRIPPAREYTEFRGRPVTPPPARYPPEYPPRIGAESTAPRYRRRSESPRPSAYDGYPANGYSGSPQAGPPPPGPPSRGVAREYNQPRNGREPIEPGYRRP